MRIAQLIFSVFITLILCSIAFAQADKISLSGGVQEAWVSRYESGTEPVSDEVSAMLIDAQGNVYVTGASEGDYATVKYNSSGVEQWVARYDSPGNSSYGGASALAVDTQGNVYVTGSSEGNGTDRDYATVKYNSAGVEQWVARYNGPGNSRDRAEALALDTEGNVYVTGRSRGNGTDNDYATVKYDSTGVEQWVARYNGPRNEIDQAVALAVDTQGNVYVTGYCAEDTPVWDLYGNYATVKYNSAGVEQWVARYDSPGNDFDGAEALAVDTQGNVYVTGYSEGASSVDYATVKYDSAGVEQWVARYNGPGNGSSHAYALALDTEGNVYVTGRSRGNGTDNDYATVKYNSAGVEQWVARYNGPGNGSDGASALAVDTQGNVYVTGYSYSSVTSSDYATVKYNSEGVEQWVARYNGPGNDDDRASALALDTQGNVYVTGYGEGVSSVDYATVKYDSEGVEQWVAPYDSPRQNSGDAKAMLVDTQGNVYVTGDSEGASSDDYATVKYNSEGVEQWVARYDGPGHHLDRASALALDTQGNVYVTGGSYGKWTRFDYATVKYDSEGVEQWVARYNGPGNGSDSAYVLALDTQGNVYVTGWSRGNGTAWDYATVKYNSEGVLQWVARYDGPGTDNESDDWARALALDTQGNVYVTGESESSGTDRDYATVKYNSAGVEQWVARYNGSGNDEREGASALALDTQGNVYVTGYSYSSVTSSDYATVKYDSSGVEQWVARYNGPGNAGDGASALALDTQGNVYVTGRSDSDVKGNGTVSGSNSDYATVKYNSAGVEQWVARYNGLGNDRDGAYALALDTQGNVYVTGRSKGNGTDHDYATVKYDSDGVEQWVARYNGPENNSDTAVALALDTQGNVYVTGSDALTRTYTTIKYTQTITGLELEIVNVPANYRLEQNYPNPFNPETSINFTVPKMSRVTLAIYDILGRKIRTLVSETKAAGSYNVTWNGENNRGQPLASGLYFYKLQAGEFSATKKMMLLK